MIQETTRKRIWTKTNVSEDDIYPLMAIRNNSSEEFVAVVSSSLRFNDIHEGNLSIFDTWDEIDGVEFCDQGKSLVFYSTDTLYIMDVE